MRISTTLLVATLSFAAPGMEAASVPALEKRKVITYPPVCIEASWKKSLFIKEDMTLLARKQSLTHGDNLVSLRPLSTFSDSLGKEQGAFFCIHNASREILKISGTNISASVTDVLDACCNEAFIW